MGRWSVLMSMAGLLAAASAAWSAETRVDFVRDIRPILSEHCFKCHGPDKQRSGLRLDHREGLLIGGDGGPAVVIGSPDQSHIIQRVTGAIADQDRMPFKAEPLGDEQIALLRAWIEQGLSWPAASDQPARRQSGHWAFQPVQRHPLPPVKNVRWPRNAIDYFILARLEAAGLTPSPQADRTTLIRRLSLDLTGLPSTPEQVDAFVNDKRPDAYEQLVEQLLRSPHYGERWGRHWLDQARYADSNGYTIDSPRSIWLYRDWVIDALNADMPFDQFTIEQIAGDLLPEPTLDQLVATGFHRNTLINQEGGTDDEQFRVETVIDRVNTTGAVWLGLTIACAQCHSHKFDPVSQREYFQLYAFFNSTQDKNAANPTLAYPSAEQQTALRDLDRKIARARAELAQHDESIAERRAAWERDVLESVANPAKWTTLTPKRFESLGGADLSLLEDQSILASGRRFHIDRYTVEAVSPLAKVTAIRLDALTHDSLPNRGPGRASNGNFVLNRITLSGADGQPRRFASASADFEQDKYPAEAAIDGKIETGWAINTGRGEGSMNQDRAAVFVLAEPLSPTADSPLSIVLEFGPKPAGYNLGRFRLSVTDQPHPAFGVTQTLAEILRTDPKKRKANQQQLLDAEFRKVDEQGAGLADQVAKLIKQREAIESKVPTTLIMRELPKPRETFVHVRGDFLRPGAPVEADVPHVMQPLPADVKNPTRLDLARWLVDPANPLTPRVTMNRLWLHYFGRGLVETENDFGTQGTPPTHPKLLDYLAASFVDGGWSLKNMHRLIVTSATYRQSSNHRSDLVAADPLNHLWGRQARFRVEAEIVRDLALAASGVLSREIGGPSVYPPQPDGVYAFTQKEQKWNTSKGNDRYRRTMYTFFFRSAPYPLLTTFDAPKFNATCTARIRSNTPLQALTLANDPMMIELAQALASRVLREAPSADDGARLTFAFRLCLSRAPDAAELQRLQKYLDQQTRRFDVDAAAAKEAAPKSLPEDVSEARGAAWAAVARVLMNLDEFVTRE